MSNQIIAKNNNIRVMFEDGELFYVVQDVIIAMGMSPKSRPSRAVAHIPDDWKKVLKCPTSGGLQRLVTINEMGLRYYIARCDSPNANKMLREILESDKSMKDIIDALDSFEIPNDLPDMYVYAIRETESGRVKLGISRDPERRLKTLQTGNSQKLELVGTRIAPNRFDDETEVHKLNSDSHVRGEWFESTAKLK